MNAFRIDPGIIRKRTRLIPSDLEASARTRNLFADECFAIEFIPDYGVFFYAVSAEIDVCNEHDSTSFQGNYTMIVGVLQFCARRPGQAYGLPNHILPQIRKGGIDMAQEKKEKYIQVGFTALRDPATGDFLPAVPLYIKAESGAMKRSRR